MNLRKFSQQTYFKQSTPVKNVNDVILEEKDEVQTDKKNYHKKNSSQFSSSNMQQQSKSQLFQKFKSFTQSTSPISKNKVKTKELTKTVSPFTIETQQKQTKAEQEEMVDRLIKWGKNRKQEALKKQEEQIKQELQQLKQKPEISKETHKIYEQGLRHHQQLNSFIKNKVQSTLANGDFPPLKKLERLKTGQKVDRDIEMDQEDDLNDESNKVVQVKIEIEQNDDNTQEIVNKEYRSKSDYTTLPIHLRYEYELQFKEAKLKELRAEKMKKFEQELELANKYHSTAEQFEHFLKEQEHFLKKKKEFYDQNLKKELEKIQENDSTYTFQPKLNFPPCPIKNNNNKSCKNEKFDEKINTLRERQHKQKEFYFFKSTLPDMRQSIKKKYDQILHKNENGVNKINDNTENVQ